MRQNQKEETREKEENARECGRPGSAAVDTVDKRLVIPDVLCARASLEPVGCNTEHYSHVPKATLSVINSSDHLARRLARQPRHGGTPAQGKYRSTEHARH